MLFTIEQARKYFGKTQREMAELMEIDRDTYRRIEKQPENATIAQVKKFCRVTGMSIDKMNFFAQ